MTSIDKRVIAFFTRYQRAIFIVGILAIIALRLYYFFVTLNQPVWWDEGDYLNIARLWAFGEPSWDINPLRPLLFPFMVAVLFKLGASELFIRFIPFISSLVSIFLVYYVGKDMYNKSVGIISALMLSVFWSFFFFSYRMLVDVPVTMLWLLSLFLFIRGYEQGKKKYLWLAIPVLVLAFLMKYTGMLLALIFIIYLLVADRLKPLKNKDLWISVGLGFLVSIPFFWYEIKKFGHPLAFYITAIGGRAASPRSLWQTFIDYVTTTFPHIHSAFLILFVIGFLLLITEIILGFDLLFKHKSKKLRSNLLLVLSFIIPFLYIVSIGYGSYIEERYLFIMYPLMFIIAARGLLCLYHYFKKYSKILAVLLVLGFLVVGSYQNLTHTDQIMEDKKESFIQVKNAGEWINQRTDSDDIIFSHHTQAEMQYHTGRAVMGIPGESPEELLDEMRKLRPKYIVVNVFVPVEEHQAWKITYPYMTPQIFTPELSYGPYIDQNQQIPILTVFSVNEEFYRT